MFRPYLVLVNKLIMSRHLTLRGAMKTKQKFLDKGVAAVVAYSIEPEAL